MNNHYTEGMLILTHDALYRIEPVFTGGFRGMGGAPYIFRLEDGSIIESRNTWMMQPDFREFLGEDTPMTSFEGTIYKGRLLCADWRLDRVKGEVPNPPQDLSALTFPHRRLGDRVYVEPKPRWNVASWCFACNKFYEETMYRCPRQDELNELGIHKSMCGDCEDHMERAALGYDPEEPSEDYFD